MADKKVERSGRERPITPTQKMKASLSDHGIVNISEMSQDKGKAALVDRFREREERWRRRQSITAHLDQHGGEDSAPTASTDEEDIREGSPRANLESDVKPTGKGGRPKGGAL